VLHVVSVVRLVMGGSVDIALTANSGQGRLNCALLLGVHQGVAAMLFIMGGRMDRPLSVGRGKGGLDRGVLGRVLLIVSYVSRVMGQVVLRLRPFLGN